MYRRLFEIMYIPLTEKVSSINGVVVTWVVAIDPPGVRFPLNAMPTFLSPPLRVPSSEGGNDVRMSEHVVTERHKILLAAPMILTSNIYRAREH